MMLRCACRSTHACASARLRTRTQGVSFAPHRARQLRLTTTNLLRSFANLLGGDKAGTMGSQASKVSKGWSPRTGAGARATGRGGKVRMRSCVWLLVLGAS